MAQDTVGRLVRRLETAPPEHADRSAAASPPAGNALQLRQPAAGFRLDDGLFAAPPVGRHGGKTPQMLALVVTEPSEALVAGMGAAG